MIERNIFVDSNWVIIQPDGIIKVKNLFVILIISMSKNLFSNSVGLKQKKRIIIIMYIKEEINLVWQKNTTIYFRYNFFIPFPSHIFLYNKKYYGLNFS